MTATVTFRSLFGSPLTPAATFALLSGGLVAVGAAASATAIRGTGARGSAPPPADSWAHGGMGSSGTASAALSEMPLLGTWASFALRRVHDALPGAPGLRS